MRNLPRVTFPVAYAEKILCFTAEAAIELHDYDAAMKALRAITMMQDPQPMSRATAFLRQAQIAALRGDARRAQHWARKAKSLDDDLAEVDAFLAQLEG